MQYQAIKIGDIIVSSPHADNGAIFNKTVILIIAHDKAGTSGVIVNRMISNIDGNSILKTLNLPIYKDLSLKVTLPVHFGGPVEPEKAIIIHSDDYISPIANSITNEILFSSDVRIITDILLNKGPNHKLMMLGYTAWTPGQLMEEIKDNSWLILPDLQKSSSLTKMQLIFQDENIYKWNNALKLAGINLGNYSISSGHA